MSGHTPGPWIAELNGHEQQIAKIAYWQVTDGAHAVCQNQFCWGARDEAQSEANARLIAAAPEMLEALKYIAKTWPDEFAARHARAAIAKAEGRS